MDFPEGWYPDPWSAHEYRWWSGTAWTEHVAQGDTRQTPPLLSNSSVGGEVTTSLAHGNTARGDRRTYEPSPPPEPWSLKGQSRLFGKQLSPVAALVVLAIFAVFVMAVWTGFSDGSSQRSDPGSAGGGDTAVAGSASEGVLAPVWWVFRHVWGPACRVTTACGASKCRIQPF